MLMGTGSRSENSAEKRREEHRANYTKSMRVIDKAKLMRNFFRGKLRSFGYLASNTCEMFVISVNFSDARTHSLNCPHNKMKLKQNSVETLLKLFSFQFHFAMRTV